MTDLPPPANGQPSDDAAPPPEEADQRLEGSDSSGVSQTDTPEGTASPEPEPDLWDDPASSPGDDSDGANDESDEDTEELDIPELPISRPAYLDGAGEVAVPKSVWPIWAWMMVGVVVIVMGVGVVGGVLLPSVVLDVVSFWPGFLLAFLLAAALWPLSRRFSSRLKATVPLLVLSWLGLAVALHLAGWSELPSSAGDLLGGPTEEIEVGSLSLEVEGLLRLSTGPQSDLYSVTMMRRGGPVGAPQALETLPNGSVEVDIVERPQSFWYSAAGWDVVLADSIPWTVAASAGNVEADLRSVAVRGGSFGGEGRIELGEVESGAVIVFDGAFDVSVAPGAVVVVEGEATVPDGWVVTELGHASPSTGDGYTLVVSGQSTVSITER